MGSGDAIAPPSFRPVCSRQAKAGIHTYRDVGGRAASGTGGRGGRSRGVEGVQTLTRLPEKGHSRIAGMGLCDWIPRPSFQTRLYHLGGCSRRRSTTYIPVGVHPCRRAFAGMTDLWGFCQSLSLCVHLSLFSLGLGLCRCLCLCHYRVMRPNRHSAPPPSFRRRPESRGAKPGC